MPSDKDSNTLNVRKEVAEGEERENVTDLIGVLSRGEGCNVHTSLLPLGEGEPEASNIVTVEDRETK